MKQFEFKKSKSVFWSYLVMMLAVLGVSVISLILSNIMSRHALTEETLARQETYLNRSCESMDVALGKTTAIPRAIEGTTYYNYLRTETSGKMPVKYMSVLPYIQKALNNQFYLKGDNEACVVYLQGTNSAVTNRRNFVNAAECFEKSIVFSKTDAQTIIELLQTRNICKLLPIQDVMIEGKTQRCVALVSHQRDISVAIMSIYNVEQILEYLGYEGLPEGSYLQISDGEEVLFAYPSVISEEVVKESYTLQGKLSSVGATVTLWIPDSYSDEILHQSMLTSVSLLVVTAILGIALCIVFSRLSTAPIRRLISAHAEIKAEPVGNEVEYLGVLIENTKLEAEILRMQMISGLLAKALSGAVLSEVDEKKLSEYLGDTARHFRVAILHTVGEEDQIKARVYLRDQLSNSVFSEPLNEVEIGVLIPGDGENLTNFRQLLETIEQSLNNRPVCGVSGLHESISNMHIAVRQAHIAMPRNDLIGIYSGSNSYSKTVSWLQHERLYQTILANDENETVALLNNIAQGIYRGSTAREMFYNIRFILRSAADEMELPYTAEEIVDYAPKFLPGENIKQLEQMIHTLFRKINHKQQQNASSRANQVLDWVKEQYPNSELCMATVAEHFNVSERTIHTMIRSASGMTFNEYLQNLRMEKASVLLLQSRLRIGEIAERCGYQAESTFYRIFKKHFGITPNQYRADGGIKQKREYLREGQND